MFDVLYLIYTKLWLGRKKSKNL